MTLRTTCSPHLQGTGRQIENFVSTAHEYLGATAEREQALAQLESLQDRWTAFQRQVADNRRLTDLAIQYFTQLEEVGAQQNGPHTWRM